jgi:hypothetical protein
MKKKKARKSSGSGGRNLCSLQECVTNKSSFSMTNYYKKVKNEKILPTKRDPMRTQWREIRKIESQSRVIFIEARFFSHPETLNQLISGGRVEQHKFNFFFFFFSSWPWLERKKYHEGTFAEVFHSPPPSSINCRTFFIIEWREYFYG